MMSCRLSGCAGHCLLTKVRYKMRISSNRNDVEICVMDGNVVVLDGKKVVFCKPKSESAVAVANDIWFCHAYQNKERSDETVHGQCI